MLWGCFFQQSYFHPTLYRYLSNSIYIPIIAYQSSLSGVTVMFSYNMHELVWFPRLRRCCLNPEGILGLWQQAGWRLRKWSSKSFFVCLFVCLFVWSSYNISLHFLLLLELLEDTGYCINASACNDWSFRESLLPRLPTKHLGLLYHHPHRSSLMKRVCEGSLELEAHAVWLATCLSLYSIFWCQTVHSSYEDLRSWTWEFSIDLHETNHPRPY